MPSLLTPRGSTKAWRKRRALVLERDGHECRYCGGWANEVDHVIPRSAGGSDDEDNLVAACRRCNQAKGGRGLKISGRVAGHLPPSVPRGSAGSSNPFLETVA